MSAMHLEPEPSEDRGEVPVAGRPAPAPEPVVVRRNAGVAATVGATASAVAIGYLWRAVQTGAVLDWLLLVAVAAVAVVHLAGLVDARTPLVVADELGLRIRLGGQWRGLPWEAVEAVEVTPRRGVLLDGRLAFHPRDLPRALDGLEARGRRAARLHRLLYGVPLAVPLGLTTRSRHADADHLLAGLVALAGGRTRLLVTAPPAGGREPGEPAAAPGGTVARPEPPAAPGPAAPGPAAPGPVAGRRRLVGGLATVVSRAAKGRSHDLDAPGAEPEDGPGPRPTPAVPLRTARTGTRVEVVREAGATGPAPVALRPDPVRGAEARALRRPGHVDLEFEPVAASAVRPMARLGTPLEPLVVDGLPEPAADPVIGPVLAAARARVGLSVDQLAERTRIRPHVIESIEVDDFAPCGGDFYARGHLRTLARVLGQDPAPLLEQYDRRYAAGPIPARRVFEAELATGPTGSVRGTSRGGSWGLLVAAVLVLLLVWGVVRYLAVDPVPPPLTGSSAPVQTGAAPGGSVPRAG